MINTLQSAILLASGQMRFRKNWEADEWVKLHQRTTTTPEEELKLWILFQKFSTEIQPKVRFNKECVANGWEKMRRNALLYLFHLIEFRSEDPHIKALFQRNLGQISFSWIIEVCRIQMPPFYYEWAYEAIPKESSRKWGLATIRPIMGSIAHMEIFQKFDERKVNRLIVKSVIES